MNRNTHSQRGSIALVLVAILVVVLIGGAGFFVWQKNKDNQKTNNQTTNSSSQPSTETKDENGKAANKTFDCKGTFSVQYPATFRASVTDAEQCLVSNVDIKEMPAVGPSTPEQLALFFNTETTDVPTAREYVTEYIERSKQDYPLELKSQQDIKLDNSGTATLATVYGGHPVKHDFYFFVFVKEGTAITTSYPLNSNHKDAALLILKSIK